jgi:hypothetical protein
MENNMRKIILLSTLMLLSCGAKKSTAKVAALTSECPKDGTCAVEIFENKSIAVKKDELGSLYYTIEDASATRVAKYTYTRKVKGEIQDAGYREEVIIELKNGDATASPNPSPPLLFGRFCFCKGQTGYYNITHRNLSITKKSNLQTVDLDFKIDEVPQIIKHITFTLK